jgi:hypothetical protein
VWVKLCVAIPKQERLKAEKRALGYLREQEASSVAETVEALLPYVQAGCAVLLADGRSALLADDAPVDFKKALGAALVQAGTPYTASTAVLLVLDDGSIRCAAPHHLTALYPELGFSPPSLDQADSHAIACR